MPPCVICPGQGAGVSCGSGKHWGGSWAGDYSGGPLGFTLPGRVGKSLAGEALSQENSTPHPTWKPVLQEALITGRVGQESRPVAAPLELSFPSYPTPHAHRSKHSDGGGRGSSPLPRLAGLWGQRGLALHLHMMFNF